VLASLGALGSAVYVRIDEFLLPHAGLRGRRIDDEWRR
jgi:hypothetical protein